jgi:hypothetical protein
MWVMHVERVQGGYIEPEIVDLEDGTGCLFRLHETDVSEDGVKMLANLLTKQAQRWAPRPPGSPLGPVIPVHWDRVPDLPDPFLIGVDDGPSAITYTVDASVISQRAADYLGRLDTERSPHWQRVPEGYHDGENDAE